jgi:hypothetical protein
MHNTVPVPETTETAEDRAREAYEKLTEVWIAVDKCMRQNDPGGWDYAEERLRGLRTGVGRTVEMLYGHQR